MSKKINIYFLLGANRGSFAASAIAHTVQGSNEASSSMDDFAQITVPDENVEYAMELLNDHEKVVKFKIDGTMGWYYGEAPDPDEEESDED